MHGATIKKTLHVSDSSSVHHPEFFTVHTAVVYGIYHCCVYSENLLKVDRGTVRNMFYFKNKFEKLVHLVDFIKRIYHEARLPELQIRARYTCQILTKIKICQ